MVSNKIVILVLLCTGVASLKSAAEHKSGAEMLELKVGDEIVLLPNDLLPRFELFRLMLKNSSFGKNYLELTQWQFINPANLRNLIAILQGADLDSYDNRQLLDLVYLIDYLDMNDGFNLLDKIISQLKQQVDLDLVTALIKMPDLNISPRLVANLVLEKSFDINTGLYFRPFSNDYWVVSPTGQAQLFKNGQVSDWEMAHVKKIFWSPNGNFFWVLFKNKTAGLYNTEGVCITGEQIVLQASYDRFTDVVWSPDSRLAAVIMGRGYEIDTYLYDTAGHNINMSTDIESIYWNNDGSRYCIVHADYFDCYDSWEHNFLLAFDTALFLDQQDTIRFSPDGQYMAVQYNDQENGVIVNCIQLIRYSAAGIQMDEKFIDFRSIRFSNFNKWAVFGGNHAWAQIYKYENGEINLIKQIANVKEVYFNPNYDQFAVSFSNGNIYFYGSDSKIKLKLKEVKRVIYNSNGQLCLVLFANGACNLYAIDEQDKLTLTAVWSDQIGSLRWHNIRDGFDWLEIHSNHAIGLYRVFFAKLASLYQLILCQYIFTKYDEHKLPFTLDQKYIKLLPKELVQSLIKNGYLTAS